MCVDLERSLQCKAVYGTLPAWTLTPRPQLSLDGSRLAPEVQLGCVFLEAHEIVFALELVPYWSLLASSHWGVASSILQHHWQHNGGTAWDATLRSWSDCRVHPDSSNIWIVYHFAWYKMVQVCAQLQKDSNGQLHVDPFQFTFSPNANLRLLDCGENIERTLICESKL